jgi:ABC-type multidrug transport system fused ATPase/permease subunit
MLVVAHRLATIHNADRIIIIDTNEIIELGEHARLLGAKGTYAKLHKAQFLD